MKYFWGHKLFGTGKKSGKINFSCKFYHFFCQKMEINCPQMSSPSETTVANKWLCRSNDIFRDSEKLKLRRMLSVVFPKPRKLRNRIAPIFQPQNSSNPSVRLFPAINPTLISCLFPRTLDYTVKERRVPIFTSEHYCLAPWNFTALTAKMTPILPF